jgi:TonB family protein
MIASWMLYTALVGALMAIAASGLESAASARRFPKRFIWFAALALSMAWPAADAARRLVPKYGRAVRVLPFTISVQSPAIIIRPAGPNWPALIDQMLVLFWLGLSALLLLRLARGMITLRRTRHAWARRDVDGTPVRLSADVGPAVVGLRSMDVVLPEWILSLDTSLRAIVLRHEEEHRSARDPYLLFVAAVAVALMPWNIALWYQARRLRLAIEMDCDARVLRAHPSPERYGLLMMTIAQRRSIAPTLFAPMLTEPTTQLERRIIAMRTTTGRLARVTVYGGTLIAVGVLAFACSLQSDNPTSPKPAPTRVTDNQTYFEFQVEKQVSPMPGNPAPRYPEILRAANISGDVLTQFVVDTSGNADMHSFKVLKTSHDLFTAAVRGALPTMHFYPALVGGRKVKQLVQMPFQFSLTPDVVAAAPVAPAVAPATVQARPGFDRTTVRKLPAVLSAVAPTGQQTYLEGQVQRTASPMPGNPSPRYPDALREANVEGEVLAEFIVDENGRPDAASLKVLRSSHDLFTKSVTAALPNMRFIPAQIDGRAVRQLVTMPFEYSLHKE